MTRSISSARTPATTRLATRNFVSSLRFKTSDSAHVDLLQNSGLPLFSQTGYSVAGWFYWTPNSALDCGLYTESNSASNIQLFYIKMPIPTSTLSHINVLIRNDANVVQINKPGNINIYPGQWYHYVWTDNNGVAKLYVNGVQDTADFTYTPATPYTFNTSTIGAIHRTGYLYFYNGNISRTQLFNKALSASEVQNLYLNGVVPTGLVGQYLFNENSGTTANDTSGQGNTGTITAATWSSNVPIGTRSVATGRTLV